MTQDFFDTAQYSLDDWLTALPTYQQTVVREMLLHGEPEEIAIRWLSASGQTDTAPLGAARLGVTLFYEKLLEELRSLFCGTESAYESERGQLVAGAKAGQAAVVTLVSGTVAPAVGVSPVLLAPAVALTLYVVTRAGRETACELLDQMIQGLQQGQQGTAAQPGQQESAEPEQPNS